MGTSNRRWVEWIWRQIGVRLPDDWECLQFARDPERGRCAFADRQRYRFELNWRHFKREPDFERMLKDYAVSLESDWKNVRPVTPTGWAGLTGQRGDEAVSRFGRYFADLSVLVELVFIHAGRRDESLEHQILMSARSVGPDVDGYQRWRAFGMDIRVPASFQLAECVVEPARIGLRFDGPHKPGRWIFRRYGMVPSWLNVPVADWLRQQANPEVRDPRSQSITKGSCGVERLNGSWRPQGLLLPRGVFASAAWVHPEDGRLYQAICVTGRKNRALHPTDGADEMLSACPEFLRVPGKED